MSDIHALSGAYAVDALDDEERAEFEQHLAECQICTAEVDSLREAASLLAEVTIGAPSAGLRARVLADITSVRPLPPLVEHGPVTQDADDSRAETSAVVEREAPAATVTELAPRRRRRAATFLAAAAAVVAIGAGGVVWTQVNDDGPTNRVEQIQAASDLQSFSVPVGDGGKATVYRSEKLNEAALVTTGMPSAPSGKQFVLWLRHGSTMTQAGVMPAGSDQTVVFSGDAASANGAAVSVEDSGDVPTSPSDDIAASFDFEA